MKNEITMSNQQKITSFLLNLEIKELNPLQQAVLDCYDSYTDFVILSPTGSGKTLSFLLPLVLDLDPALKGIQTLIIAPTRELALQIESVVKTMKTGFKTNCVYGGHKIWIERNDLSVQPSLLIGTPGRIVDHIEHNRLNLKHVKNVVLDEFDKTLEFGFEKDIQFILNQLPKNKKQLFTSATQAIEFPNFIQFNKKHEINFLESTTLEKRLQFKKVVIEDRDKLVDLKQLLYDLGNEPTLVFCNHREPVERISYMLKKEGIVHDIFHGGLDQKERERTLIKYRNKSCNLLITTDLAARGIDISMIQNIIHYHLPVSEDAFIHRNGRTARVNETGTIFLLLNPDDTLPEYIKENITLYHPAKNIEFITNPHFETLYIGKGKKDKVNKGDILGFLSHQTDLDKNDIGQIDVRDYFSYVAITRSKMKNTLKQIRNKKIKNKKAKFDVAK
ncbi:RNA helicase [Flavobacteriaceae bacterium UJ101]|nr:RNA helicase [Flavobacteriaceae bacterium UJ101]